MTPITFADAFRTQKQNLTRNQLKTLRAKTRRQLPQEQWASNKQVVVGSEHFVDVIQIAFAA